MSDNLSTNILESKVNMGFVKLSLDVGAVSEWAANLHGGRLKPSLSQALIEIGETISSSPLALDGNANGADIIKDGLILGRVSFDPEEQAEKT